MSMTEKKGSKQMFLPYHSSARGGGIYYLGCRNLRHESVQGQSPILPSPTCRQWVELGLRKSGTLIRLHDRIETWPVFQSSRQLHLRASGEVGGILGAIPPSWKARHHQSP